MFLRAQILESDFLVLALASFITLALVPLSVMLNSTLPHRIIVKDKNR